MIRRDVRFQTEVSDNQDVILKNLIEIQIPISTHRYSERISWAYRDIRWVSSQPLSCQQVWATGLVPIQSVQQSWYLLFPKACLLQLSKLLLRPQNLGLKTLWDAKGLDQSWADPSFQPRTLTTVEQPCANSSWRVRVWEAGIGLFLKIVLLIF